MRVLLVSFNFCRDDECRDPYGVSCLLTAFREKRETDDEIFSYVVDLNRYTINNHISDEAIAAIKDCIIWQIKDKCCDVIALSNFVWADWIIREIGLPIKYQFPNKVILMGGAMVKPFPNEFWQNNSPYLGTKYPFVDGFIYSYGEKVFANLSEYIDKLHKSKYNLICDLPNYCCLKSPYISGQIPLSPNMSVRMETRRGCCFKCSYCCHKTDDRKVNQVRNGSKWRAELSLFMKNDVSKINILDPFFNDPYNDNVGLKVMKTVQDMKCRIPISVQIRPEFINEDYLNIAELLGNFIFEIGIQSLDRNVLPLIGRNNANACRAVTLIKNKLSMLKQCRNIRSEVTLIYGLPNQTVDSFRRDIEYFLTLGVNRITAFPLQLYLGTDIYREYKQYGLSAKEIEPYKILQICDNPNHDFEKMQAFAESLEKINNQEEQRRLYA